MKYFSPQFIGLPLFFLKDSPPLTKIVYVGGDEKNICLSIHTIRTKVDFSPFEEDEQSSSRWRKDGQSAEGDIGWKFAESWRFKSTLNRFSFPVYA